MVTIVRAHRAASCIHDTRFHHDAVEVLKISTLTRFNLLIYFLRFEAAVLPPLTIKRLGLCEYPGR